MIIKTIATTLSKFRSPKLPEPCFNTDSSVYRILMLCDRHAATQEISFIRPLASLLEKGEIGICAYDEATFNDTHANDAPALIKAITKKIQPDVVIFSRYSGPFVEDWTDHLKRKKIPIVCHLDDDLFSVPEDLGISKFRYYNDPVRQQRLRKITQMADIVYASTAILADRIAELNLNTNISSGQVYCGIEAEKITPPIAQPAIFKVGYMGTAGHTKDLDIALPAIIKLLDERNDFEFELFGTIKMPDELTRFGKRVHKIPATENYEIFLQTLPSLGWAVGIAPLAQTDFNAAKANTKWVEYSFSGMAVLASDHCVYKTASQGESALLTNDNDWEISLRSMIDNMPLCHSLTSNAQIKLKSEYTLHHVREQLFTCFRDAGAEYPASLVNSNRFQ